MNRLKLGDCLKLNPTTIAPGEVIKRQLVAETLPNCVYYSQFLLC